MAVYFPDANVLFIHIPKTGGTWVQKASQLAKIHTISVPPRSSRKCHKHLPRDRYGYEDALTWTAVRRPDDWYVSWFRYARQCGWPDYRELLDHPQTCLADCATDSFEQFVACCLSRHPGYLSALYDRYTAGLDFVGTTENLAQDFRRVLGPRMKLPALDPTPRHVTQGPLPFWPPGLREQLLEAEAAAMRFWTRAYRELISRAA